MSDLSASIQIAAPITGLIPSIPLRAAPVAFGAGSDPSADFGAALVGLLTPRPVVSDEAERQRTAGTGKDLPEDKVVGDPLLAWAPLTIDPSLHPLPSRVTEASPISLAGTVTGDTPDRAADIAPDVATPTPIVSVTAPGTGDRAASVAPGVAAPTTAVGATAQTAPAATPLPLPPVGESAAPNAIPVPADAAAAMVLPVPQAAPAVRETVSVQAQTALPGQATPPPYQAVAPALTPITVPMPVTIQSPAAPMLRTAAHAPDAISVPVAASSSPDSPQPTPSRFDTSTPREITRTAGRDNAPPAPAFVALQPAVPATSSGIAAQVFATAVSAAPARPVQTEPLGEPSAMAALTGAEPSLRVQQPASAGQPSLDMSRDDWTGQMIDRIAALRDSAEAADTRIKLAPENLGALEVSIRRDGDRIHVHFTAENPAARQMIADAAPRLAELADARGLKLGQASVDAGNGGGSQQQNGQREPQPAPNTTTRQSSAGSQPDPTDNDRIA